MEGQLFVTYDIKSISYEPNEVTGELEVRLKYEWKVEKVKLAKNPTEKPTFTLLDYTAGDYSTPVKGKPSPEGYRAKAKNLTRQLEDDLRNHVLEHMRDRKYH